MLMGLKHFKHSKGTYPKVFNDADLCQITVPTLLLIGDHEVIYNPVRALARAKRLIPNVEATLVPETSHLLVLEKPDVVNRHILEFLGRVEATVKG
jgi:pimeloyl-ACP methyl ester carboxylesterase